MIKIKLKKTLKRVGYDLKKGFSVEKVEALSKEQLPREYLDGRPCCWNFNHSLLVKMTDGDVVLPRQHYYFTGNYQFYPALTPLASYPYSVEEMQLFIRELRRAGKRLRDINNRWVGEVNVPIGSVQLKLKKSVENGEKGYVFLGASGVRPAKSLPEEYRIINSGPMFWGYSSLFLKGDIILSDGEAFGLNRGNFYTEEKMNHCIDIMKRATSRLREINSKIRMIEDEKKRLVAGWHGSIKIVI